LSRRPVGLELNQTVYALDATTIDLCLSLSIRGSFAAEHQRSNWISAAATVVIVTSWESISW